MPDNPPVVGAVCIGRNEGERLRTCLKSLAGRVDAIVYVDSGSTDTSVQLARNLGADVVELDMSIPFTAARARNAGLAKLQQLLPNLDFVQFVDGDCEVIEGWIEAAVEKLAASPELAVVTGRRIERAPDRTVYNRLCDLEWRWNSNYGEIRAFGGDALVLVHAFNAVGGYEESIIAGEEPELSFRLRRAGWKLFRLDRDMTLHDAAMTRASQWWKRAMRAGHAYAEAVWLHGRSPLRYGLRESAGIWFWGLGLPAAALAGTALVGPWSLLLLAGYPVSAYKTARYYRGKGMPPDDARIYAANCVLAKFPGLVGQLKFAATRARGRRSTIIEYK